MPDHQPADRRNLTGRRLALPIALFLSVFVGAGTRARAAEPEHELVIFEAASLKDVFARLASRFGQQHPGIQVVTNAAGSQELRTQIEHGASADLFASADRKQMQALAAQGLVTAPEIFTCNEPVVVVRPGLASTIKTFADLPRADRIVIGTPEVPIGAYTLQILQKSDGGAKYGPDFAQRVQAKVASRELNVRQVLAKVVLGEADAAIVYRSDAMASAGKVLVLPIPAEVNITAEYPIALLKGAPHPALSRAWIALVESAAGRAALREAGFLPCPPR
ncbi:MAG TPA: molybdate ABC transporter substrate-binding protein [Polyangia bacterium]|nr:molybdate ABC transporter substrate-binding protein [Polyangia bacterium]